MEFNSLVEMTSVDNWDHDNARAVSAEDWASIRAFAQACLTLSQSNVEPSYSACGDGSPHVRWSPSADEWMEVEHIRGVFCCSILTGGVFLCIEDMTPGAAMDTVLRFLQGSGGPRALRKDA